MSEATAQEALALAKEVDSNQVAHDTLCAFRYKTMGTNIGALAADIELLYDRMWKAAKGIIILLVGLLISVIGVLFTVLHNL